MNYLVNKVNVDGRGISIKENLEEAKKEWASMYIEIYEVTDSQLETIRTDCTGDYKEACSYLKANCNMVYKS